MKIKTILAAAVMAAGFGTAGAQNIYETGRVIVSPTFDAGMRQLMAGQDNIYGTARSAAMGGAFTSLGADLSSMSINPAGLGMYQGSDWGVSAAVSHDLMSTTSRGMAAGALSAGGGRLSAGLNNFGAAYNIFDGSGTLTSVTVAFGYNRAANFNSRTRLNTYFEDSSISEVFGGLLNYHGYSPDMLEPNAYPFDNLDIPLNHWGAVLGYQSGMIGTGDYNPVTIPSDDSFTSKTRGGVYQYDLAMGFNLRNVLYLGMTLGISDVSYTENTTYGEVYPISSSHSSMRFDQHSQIKGAGATVKLGLIARPVEALRIGVAFHSPTFYSLQKHYDGFMQMDGNWASTGDLLLERRLNTAPRLMAGISGVVGGRAIVALDWETAWYNKVRERDYIAESLAESEYYFKPSNTVRAGVEFLLSDAVSLRAGGSYMPDIMRTKSLALSNPVARSGFSATAGAGFRFGRGGYVDVAWVYNRARMTDYELYYFNDGNSVAVGQHNPANGSERFYTPTRHHNMLTLTVGQRF